MMSVLNQSGEEQVECPLCLGPLRVDDLNFFPCTCGYQICRFCWHHIRTDENGLCPACRNVYPEIRAYFKPLTKDEVSKLKAKKRDKDQLRKQEVTEIRRHLANVRVVQRNLVFVVGLPMRLADSEVLKRHEYFGKFGKIHKVVINQSTSYAGSQGPSASAYVTYHTADDALRAIQAVNNIVVDRRTIKTSLGTTKYCSHFIRNKICPKPDCTYLHDFGDIEARFTRMDILEGKHQEYERKLHEQLLNSYNQGNRDRKPTPSPPAVAAAHCKSNSLVNKGGKDTKMSASAAGSAGSRVSAVGPAASSLTPLFTLPSNISSKKCQNNEEMSPKENQRATDDDLGFDPFHEAQKALAEIIEKENMMLMLYGQHNHVPHPNSHMSHISQLHQQYHQMNRINHHPAQFTQATMFGSTKILPSCHAPLQPHLLQNNHRLQAGVAPVCACGKMDGLALGPGPGPGSVPPRARLPPPGFTVPYHMNAFGLGIPRPATSTGSKILPFMGLGNGSNSSNTGTSSPIPQNLNSISPNISISSALNAQQNVHVHPSPLLFSHSNSHSSTATQLNSAFSTQNGTAAHSSAVPKSASDSFITKEWPDNLRLLLPNINAGSGVSQSPVPVAFSGSNTPTPPFPSLF